MRLEKNILLSILTGVLLALSWPEIGNQAWLVFIALVPLLHLIRKLKNWRNIFLYSFFSFLLWHMLTAWWMWYSTPIGSLSAWIINSMLMAGVLTISRYSTRKLKFIPFEILLAIYWLGFEIFHLYWDLKWPWMNLGHAFANNTNWIQWYEYTGVYGGTFWVIISNGLIYRILNNRKINTKQIYLIVLTLLFILTPIYLSHSKLPNRTSKHPCLKVTIVQPNIDTYTEKFNALPPLEQSKKLIDLIKNVDSTSLVLLPETSIPESFSLSQVKPESIETLLNFSETKKTDIIGGFYTKDDKYSYNSTCFIEDGKITASRNKIKLLAYAEKIPFDFISGYWNQLVHKQGGIDNSFGIDQEAKPFKLNDSTQVGVLICFESIFSDIAAEICRNGAQALFIITNDDWWNDSPGHRQHFSYARIKAIETRKWIARSANTGISGLINDRGEIIESTKYKETKVLNSKIELNTYTTFFTSQEKKIRTIIITIAIFLFFISTFIKLNPKPDS